MQPVVLLYTENVVLRQRRKVKQRLVFCVAVEHLGWGKTVDILWAGEDGHWHTLGAHYQRHHDAQTEHWRAETCVTLTSGRSLPGNVRFCIRCRAGEQEFWDNNYGNDYHCEADSGVQLGDAALLHLDYQPLLDTSSRQLLLRIATARQADAPEPVIEWSVDDWQSRQTTECQYRIDEWDRHYRSNARNPNQYGVTIWTATLACEDIFRLQYRIGLRRDELTAWDDAHRYICQRPPLRLLILNLHCYQEEAQLTKLKLIARAMQEHEVDIACLQEVAEHWNEGHGDWSSNTARLINEQLPHPFHLHCDWSHRGFDRYREGVAILSRYPILDYQSRYVSESHDMLDIHSRKVVMATVDVPGCGKLNVYSAHLSWIEDGFASQFETLDKWAGHNHRADIAATLLCGDFNVTVGSEGYRLVVENGHYDDQFLLANQAGVFAKIFRQQDPHWQDLSSADYRIDYVFMNREAGLRVTDADVLFTDDDYGRVSDHCGYLLTFEPLISPRDNYRGDYRDNSHKNDNGKRGNSESKK